MDNESIAEKTVGNSQTASPLHGVNGLFATPGLERDVVSAVVKPYGISSVLPIYPNNDEDPRFGSITGFTALSSSSRPTTPCEDAPYGYIKGCNLTAKFGMLRLDTNVIDVMHILNKRNRGDFTDLMLRGSLLGMSNLAPRSLTEDDVMNIVLKSEMIIAGSNAERMLSEDIWQGTVANTFPGLDVQIATGQKDADTGTLCPALDSDVKSFAYNDIAGNGLDIVEYLSMIEYYCRYNAETMGLMPAQWVFAMRPQLFQELTAVWPVRYWTNRGNTNNVASGSSMTIDGRDVIMERDSMRNGKYIDVNGNRYPVVTDTGIFEHNSTNNANLAPGEYASSIYFVPLTINGNFPVTYRQYLDYAANDTVAKRYLNGLSTFWTDGGQYSWAVETNKWCVKLSLRTEQRIVLRTPQLAGKLQHVKYIPLQHLREPYPTSPYFVDGGVSARTGTSGSAVWSI